MPSSCPLRPFLRCLLAGLAVAGFAAAAAAAPTVAEALAVEPRQPGVDCDRPTADEAGSATIKQEKLDGISALVVRGADGRILRSFADTNGDRVVDRWSFFKDGLEVYRDVDGDDPDTKADQSRWLTSGGTRWGVDADGDGALDSWRAISAEETTAEIVRALGSRDAAAFARLLPTKADLETAGFTGPKLEELVARATAAKQGFAKLAAAQMKVGPKTVWTSMLTPQPPGVLPAGSPGVDRDVVAYDNVVALAEQAGNGVQVIVGSLVRCGDAWRPVDAPQLPDGDGRLAETPGFFAPAGASMVAGGDAAGVDEALRPLLAALREIEDRMAAADAAGRRQLAGQYVGKLGELAAAAGVADRAFWSRQLVETVAAYVQEGLLPEGLAVLEKIAAGAKDDHELLAFVDFRLVQARYAAGMEAGADPQKLQDEWFASLAKFVEDHPQANEAAEALLQLAFRDEFEGRDAEAVARYGEIAKTFAGSPQARKAAGAVRLFESVGKPLPLTGTTLDGKQVTMDSFKGRPVLVHYWSTDCEPCKVDLAQIRELQAKYGPQRFACVGVALDADRQKLAKFLSGKPLPWPQLHDEGGLDGKLAESFGVLALPTMILVAADGTVADRNVSITDLEKKLAALLEGK